VDRRLAMGLAAADALSAWWAEHADTRASDAVAVAAATLTIAIEAGAPAAPAIEQMARALRDEDAARAEVRAQSAQGRASAYVVASLPVAALMLSSLADPGTASAALGHPLGRWCLGLGVGFEIAGLAWIRRIVNDTVPRAAR